MKKIILTLLFVGSVLQTTAQGFEKINLGFGKATLVKYSPNNDVIAFAFGRSVKLFRSGIQVGEMKGHVGAITGMNFDLEGELIVTTHTSGWVNIWNVRSRKKLGEFKIDHGLLNGEFLQSPKRILTLSGKNIYIHDLDGTQILDRPSESGSNTSLTVSRNGLLIATSNDNGIVSIWDDRGELKHEIETGAKNVHEMALAPDGSTLAVASSSGRIDVWDVASGDWITTLLDALGRFNSLEFSNDAEYLAAGGEAFYILSVSQKHADIIYKKIHGDVVSSSFSFDGHQVCMLEDLNTFARVYDISDLNIPPYFNFRNENDNLAPLVYISNPPKIVNDRINYSKDLIDLEGSVFDNFGVRNLIVNGVKTPVQQNGQFIIHLSLNMGENPVTIQANDINGNTVTRKFTINRRGDMGEYDPLMARNYLFAVGINSYKHWPSLNNAVKDANDLATTLLNDYQFEFSDITVLKDEQASLSNIYAGLRSMIEKVTPQDNLIVYFSGHGYFDELLNEGFWIPVDAKSDALGEYLPNTSILKILENINSQHTLLIADACFAGSLFTEASRADGGYIEKVGKLRSRWGLASGRLEEVSDGPVGTNSPFARVLLNYLGTNQEDEFAVSQLFSM